jgi:hypothetical protein
MDVPFIAHVGHRHYRNKSHYYTEWAQGNFGLSPFSWMGCITSADRFRENLYDESQRHEVACAYGFGNVNGRAVSDSKTERKPVAH